MSNETSARIEGESGPQMKQLIDCDFCKGSGSTNLLTDDRKAIIASNLTCPKCGGNKKISAAPPEPKVGESGLSDEQFVRQVRPHAYCDRIVGAEVVRVIIDGKGPSLSKDCSTCEEAWADAAAKLPEAKPEPLPNTLQEEPDGEDENVMGFNAFVRCANHCTWRGCEEDLNDDEDGNEPHCPLCDSNSFIIEDNAAFEASRLAAPKVVDSKLCVNCGEPARSYAMGDYHLDGSSICIKNGGQSYCKIVDSREEKICKHGDRYCPCPDGDPCHYEGENPMPKPEEQEPARPVSKSYPRHGSGFFAYYDLAETDAFITALEAENKLLKSESVAPPSLPTLDFDDWYRENRKSIRKEYYEQDRWQESYLFAKAAWNASRAAAPVALPTHQIVSVDVTGLYATVLCSCGRTFVAASRARARASFEVHLPNIAPIIHEGFSTHRLRQNPLEAAYAEAWKRDAPRTLGWLLSGPENRNDVDYSPRDAKVAATIIQWLGSPVGSGFVSEVLAHLPEKEGK